METEIIRMFKEVNPDGTKVHLKQLLNIGYKGLIPTNIILNKVLPGLGATTCEIECHRHSIIIEPNVPVIDGKVAKYPNERWPYPILGVRKGTSSQKIRDYLTNDKIPFKKILVTPESYQHKLLKAFTDVKYNTHYEDFFYLLDECEKFAQDADFRKGLFFIMRDFWKYKSKAMVSATPVIPSDKAFINQGFRILKIDPKFDYKKPITVTTTNSVLDCVKAKFADITQDRVCIYVNSINIADNIIKLLDIKADARIFCSEDSIPKIKDLGYTDYSTIIKQTSEKYSDLKKYNFFTSRFFSAVDIDLKDDNVAVVIVSDNYLAPHSIVDPQTHVKQILGRFREKSQFNTHITNTREDLIFRSKDHILKNIQGMYIGFKAVHTLYCNEENLIIKESLKNTLKDMRFFDYIFNYDNKIAINHLLIDNEIEDEKVKKLYTKDTFLKNAYREDDYYDLTENTSLFLKSDKSRYEIAKMSLAELRKQMVSTYYKILYGELEGYLADYFTDYQLQQEGGFIIGAAQYLYVEDLEKFNYNPAIIDPILNVLLSIDEKEIPVLKKAIRKDFIKGKTYSAKYITDKLNTIFNRIGIDKSTKATGLSNYCLLSERVNVGKNGMKMSDEKDRVKGYLIIEYLLSEQ